MKILALESSAQTASCAICEQDMVICESSITAGLTHSQTLMVMVENMFKNARQNPSEISAIAVSIGPGSFTGLRIGVSAAKGMAQALKCECVGVSTLWGLAKNLEGFDAIACAVMDARNSQVYNALFKIGGGKIKRLCKDRALSIDELENQIIESGFDLPVVLVGDGAKICFEKMKKFPKFKLAPPNLRLQRASSVGFCGLEKIKNEILDPGAIIFPKYLRLSQAERMRNNLKNQEEIK